MSAREVADRSPLDAAERYFKSFNARAKQGPKEYG
jgi:hypothetical protein